MTAPIQLKGKTALITGASRGIGEATARYLTTLGVNVAMAARSTDRIQEIAKELGPSAIAIPCDVADWSSAAAAVRETVKAFGTADILINNAGQIEPIARIEDADPLAWGRVVDVNLKGPFNMLRAVIPVMKSQERGLVVNLSSGAATSALEGWSHYCATKAGLLSLTRTAHRELHSFGISVVGLSPGTVATKIQKEIKASGINPVSQLDWGAHIPAEWVARSIAWLTTPEAREFDGDDFSLKSAEGKAAVGLPVA